MTLRKALCKVILLGDTGTGKTSTITQWVDRQFSPLTKTTIGLDCVTKSIIVDEVNVKLQLWDTAGLERWKMPLFLTIPCSTAHVFFLFYDITRPETLANIPTWLSEIEQRAGSLEGRVFCLVGNKADLVEQRKVNEADVQAMLITIKERFKLDALPQHKEISAKEGVDELFAAILRQLLSKFSPDDNEVPPPLVAQTQPEPVNNVSRNVALTVAAVLTVVAVALAIAFWPLILGLALVDMVFLPIFAIAFIGVSALGASIITDNCISPTKDEMNPSTRGIFTDLGVTHDISRNTTADAPLHNLYNAEQVVTPLPQLEQDKRDESKVGITLRKS